MIDYDIVSNPTKNFYDNSSAICLSKNLVHHSKAKHIDIKYHFIRDHIFNGNIEINFINTKNQLTDILTKPLSEERFCNLRNFLNIISIFFKIWLLLRFCLN